MSDPLARLCSNSPPFIITLESNVKFMKLKEIVTSVRDSWLSNKFSSSVPKEMWWEELIGEYKFWGVMGYQGSAN